MRSWSGKSLVALLVALLALCTAVPCAAQGAGKIIGVRLSADYKKLVITSEGSIGMPNVVPCFKPAKLILDFSGSRPGAGLKSPKAEAEGAPDVRVGATAAGTRVELDFGKSPLPRYRIRKLNDYVIVFLERSGVASVPKLSSRPHVAPVKPNPPRLSTSPKRKTVAKRAESPASRTPHRDGLLIKSSSVEDGNIVLHVADGKKPRREYRIQLGVDLSQPGFKSAEIRRSPGKGTKGPS